MARKREAGQALFIAVLLLTVLMLAAGLAIDMGYLRLQKRRMQSAADSAAIAGADELAYNATNYMVAAKNDAAANGFTDTSLGGTATVTVSSPPVDGPYAGTANYVEVAITQSQPTFFMKAVGTDSESVSTLAVAGLRAGPTCIYATGTGGAGSLASITTLNPIEMDLVVNNCSIDDNGQLDPAHASDHFQASSIGDSDGNCTPISGGSCEYITPTQQKTVPAADPLGYLTPPGSPGACGGGMPTQYNHVGSNGSPVSIPAGTYPCGIQITGGSVVTMSGTYILGSPSGNTDNGSPLAPSCTTGPYNTCAALLISGNFTNVSGSGVTIYNQTGATLLCVADQNSTNDGTICGQNGMDWGGTPTVNLSAPTSGSYSGILFYQNASDAAPATFAGSDDNSGNGNNTFLEGALYYPGASLTVYDLTDGNNWQNTYTILDAFQIILAGRINLGSDYSSLTPPPIRDAYLTE